MCTFDWGCLCGCVRVLLNFMEMLIMKTNTYEFPEFLHQKDYLFHFPMSFSKYPHILWSKYFWVSQIGKIINSTLRTITCCWHYLIKAKVLLTSKRKERYNFRIKQNNLIWMNLSSKYFSSFSDFTEPDEHFIMKSFRN